MCSQSTRKEVREVKMKEIVFMLECLINMGIHHSMLTVISITYEQATEISKLDFDILIV